MTDVIQMSGALDPRESWTAEGCSIVRAVEIVHARSTFQLLREAFYGTTRFDEFAQRTGLSEPVTAARLRELTDEGILMREPYREPGQRTRHHYRLTEKGAELLPVLVGLMQWGDRWAQESGGPVELHHTGCGARVEAELRCSEGHVVSPAELELALGPGSRRKRRA